MKKEVSLKIHLDKKKMAKYMDLGPGTNNHKS